MDFQQPNQQPISPQPEPNIQSTPPVFTQPPKNTMNKLSKVLGVFLIVISVIGIGVTFFISKTDELNWIEFILPILTALFLVLPSGIFYFRRGNVQLFGATKVALWFHIISVILIILGSLPIVGCIIRLACLGLGAPILFVIFTVPAAVIYCLGSVILLCDYIYLRFKK
ncbi:hypothetical protein KKH14_00835 [Patescibacteria group bacterium]|nr:hypothetical protein [Patescibacteria group bacterium]